MVTVTRQDIQKGRRGDCYGCPIALALARTFPGKKIEVWTHQVVIEDDGALLVVALPPVAQRFIAGYDINRIRPYTCPSFEFELDMEKATRIVPTRWAYEEV